MHTEHYSDETSLSYTSDKAKEELSDKKKSLLLLSHWSLGASKVKKKKMNRVRRAL